jgi:hypothetical protein
MTRYASPTEGPPCACRKLDPRIWVMQSAQDGAAEYATYGLDCARGIGASLFKDRYVRVSL